MVFAVRCSKKGRPGSAHKEDVSETRYPDPLHASLPPPIMRRVDREPPTSNSTYWGGSSQPLCSKPAPTSLGDTKWITSNTIDFGEEKRVERITKDMQIQRANFMRSSDVSLGQMETPYVVSTHHYYKPYERDRLVGVDIAVVGGSSSHKKFTSDVSLKSAAGLGVTNPETVAGKPVAGLTSPKEASGELRKDIMMTMTHRQYVELEGGRVDPGKWKEARVGNKKDMIATHFPIGPERSVDYRTVLHEPLTHAQQRRPTTGIARSKLQAALLGAPHGELEEESYLLTNKEKDAHDLAKDLAEARKRNAEIVSKRTESSIPLSYKGARLDGKPTTQTNFQPPRDVEKAKPFMQNNVVCSSLALLGSAAEKMDRLPPQQKSAASPSPPQVGGTSVSPTPKQPNKGRWVSSNRAQYPGIYFDSKLPRSQVNVADAGQQRRNSKSEMQQSHFRIS